MPAETDQHDRCVMAAGSRSDDNRQAVLAGTDNNNFFELGVICNKAVFDTGWAGFTPVTIAAFVTIRFAEPARLTALSDKSRTKLVDCRAQVVGRSKRQPRSANVLSPSRLGTGKPTCHRQ
jgi:hypothetical protein